MRSHPHGPPSRATALTHTPGKLVVLIELSEPSPAHTLVLTSTLPNSTPHGDTKILTRTRQANACRLLRATTHDCPGRAPVPRRALTNPCHPRPARNGRPLFMNKDALHFLKRGRGGAPSYSMPSKPLLPRFFAKRVNRSLSTPSFRKRPVLRGLPIPKLRHAREWLALFPEDGIGIPYPTSRAWDRDKTGMAAFDPP